MVYCIHQLREPRPVCPLMKVFQDFLVAQWLRLPCNAVGVGSIPGQEAKIIPHAFQSKIQNKQQTQYCKKFICGGSVCMSYPTCDPVDCSTPCLPVPHNLAEFAQVHVH